MNRHDSDEDLQLLTLILHELLRSLHRRPVHIILVPISVAVVAAAVAIAAAAGVVEAAEAAVAAAPVLV